MAVLTGLLNYTPFQKKIIEMSLKEMMQENIQYVEIRSNFASFYKLTGKLTEVEAFQFVKGVCTEFATQNEVSKEPNQGIFVKFMYTGATQNPDKKEQANIFEIYRGLVKKDKEIKPGFLSGLYLIGSKEDASPASPLLDAYVPHIKQLETDPDTRNTSYYFNAGLNKMYTISDDLVCTYHTLLNLQFTRKQVEMQLNARFNRKTNIQSKIFFLMIPFSMMRHCWPSVLEMPTLCPNTHI